MALLDQKVHDEKEVSAHLEGGIDDTVKAMEHHEVADTEAKAYVREGLTLTKEQDKKLFWRINRRVLPFLMLAYFLQSIDKSATGMALIMGWQEDVGSSGNDISNVTSLFWAGFICAEPFSAQLVRRFPVAKLLGSGILTWSFINVGLAFCKKVPVILALRFILGVTESLVGPSLLTLTVQWYKRSEQPFTSACWQVMVGINVIHNSLIAYAFYHVKYVRGMNGWQWMTLYIGLLSFVCGVTFLIFVPDSPTQARWASEEEKTQLVERVRENNQGLKNKEFKRDQAMEAFKDPMTYLYFALPCVETLVVGGIGAFGTLLINKGFGFTVLQTQLVNIPQGVWIICTQLLLLAVLIPRTGQTILCILGFIVPNVVGTIVLLTVAPSSKTRAGLLVSYYIMQFFQAVNPALLLMLQRNSAGQTKRSITYAAAYMGWAAGNTVAPQLFSYKWAPRYINTLYIHLGVYGLFAILAVVARQILAKRNKVKEAQRGGQRPDNLLAFDDLTDIQNPDFVYMY